ncbi:MAG TPA: methyltransferase domain-containing protein [Gaiellaceae bacterium]|nr:methyltransferase domain-containing protein [Gaiellaceae bacterium]
MSPVRGIARRAAWSAAVRMGLQVYDPSPENLPQLAALTEYVEDPRPIGDVRPTTATDELPDLTLVPEALAGVVDVDRFRGARVLEVGPKYGVHARWIDRELEPSELVFSDFESDAGLHAKWVDSLERPHRFVYGDLRLARELLDDEPFDLVFFLGVLYHSIHHLPLLGMLNRLTKPGGTMLFETTVDPRPDALVRLRWPENGKAKGVPTIQAVRLELAWTGWRKVTRFTDYRPGSSEALFSCEKTDELRDGADLADVVTPHRPR